MPTKKIVKEIHKIVISKLAEEMDSEDCVFCGKANHPAKMHRHSNGYVCEECWDERLRVTE